MMSQLLVIVALAKELPFRDGHARTGFEGYSEG